MKITFAIPYFYPAWQYGGVPRSAFELARGLARRGHSVRVLTTDSAGETRIRDLEQNQERNVEGIDVYYCRNVSNALAYHQRVFWSPEFARQIRKRMTNTDVVHVHELRSTTSIFAFRAAQRARMPYALSAHGGLKHLGKRMAKAAFDSLWGNQIMAHAAAFIAVSLIEEREAQTFGVESRRIRRLANALDLEAYHDLPPREAFRSRWRIEAGTVILFLGRLHWVKGADLLVEAFQKARQQQGDIHLVVAGPDEGQETHLQKRIQALHLDQSVTFTGFLNDSQKIEALTGSDVLVVPSRSEVFALTAIESLACGTPVIMSSACGLYPMPSEEQGIRTFESENVDDLTDKLLGMAGRKPFRHNVAAGRDFVFREFSPDVIAAQAEGIYGEILQRHD